jgi:tetratricopeptide (TPR) repeat protein
MFSEALTLLGENQYDKAITALEGVVAEAKTLGHVGLARSAANRLAALRARSEKKATGSMNPVLEAQILLNCGASDQALDLVGKALKADAGDARLFYLKAIAHAQKEEAEAAAADVKQAIALNQELMHQYRLEKDFDRVRSSSAFVSLGMD